MSWQGSRRRIPDHAVSGGEVIAELKPGKQHRKFAAAGLVLGDATEAGSDRATAVI
jgi:hypothetical protein